jgi:hypothetical protein
MGAIDSKHSLDDSRKGRDIRPMENAENCAERKVQMLLLERRDENRNMARFYVLAIEPTLFGDSALVGVVTLSKEERERAASPVFSSSRDRLAPGLHRNVAEGATRSG